MKSIFTLLLVTIIHVAYTQKYQPLVEEGKYWIYGHYDYSSCFLMGQRLIEIRYFEGDTTILNQQYKKLISAYGSPQNSKIEIYEKKTVCLMREDTLQQKVFMINNDFDLFPCTDSLEICIWDFSLEVGDTTTQCVSNMFLSVGIDGFTHCIVDSILKSPNGKVLFTKGVSPGTCGDLALRTVFYVEGHGMDVGPMFKKINILFSNYCEGTLEQCNIISSTKEDNSAHHAKINIHPNPASDYISFSLMDDIVSSINGYCIRELTGNILKNVTSLESGTNYIIHTLDFPSGMYIIQFLNEFKIIQSEKFIVTH